MTALIVVSCYGVNAQNYEQYIPEQYRELLKQQRSHIDSVMRNTNTVLSSSAQQVKSDSVGIYCYLDGSFQQMEPINYSGMKANTLGSALTYGIAKTKLKMEFAGATSPYKFYGGKAKFRFFFGHCPVGKVVRYYMFTGNYGMRDFQVTKFDVKGDKRKLVSASVSIWTGINTGTNKSDDVTINYKQIRDGVYDVEVSGNPGEYCFTFTLNGVGAATTVFDFTLQ